MPADCSIALLQSTHLPLWMTEALFEALLAMAAVAGMYLAARRVGRLLAFDSRIAAIVAALFWVANPFALGYIWYHVLYVQLLWAALPWLGLFVLAAAEDRKIREAVSRRVRRECRGVARAHAGGVAPGVHRAGVSLPFRRSYERPEGTPQVRRCSRLVRERASMVAAAVAH